jgi:hypothetical protein
LHHLQQHFYGIIHLKLLENCIYMENTIQTMVSGTALIWFKNIDAVADKWFFAT